MIVMVMLMIVMTGLSGAGSRPGQAAGPRREDHGGGDRDQEAGDGSLQVQVHHAQQRGQGQLHKINLRPSCYRIYYHKLICQKLLANYKRI